MTRRRRVARLLDRLAAFVFAPNLAVRDAFTQDQIDARIDEWARRR
jgi:hypothetical protein